MMMGNRNGGTMGFSNLNRNKNVIVPVKSGASGGESAQKPRPAVLDRPLRFFFFSKL